jgi:hypothetical protein
MNRIDDERRRADVLNKDCPCRCGLANEEESDHSCALLNYQDGSIPEEAHDGFWSGSIRGHLYAKDRNEQCARYFAFP